MLKFVETRIIDLPKGGTLTIELTQEMIYQIRKIFDLDDGPITDDVLRMFFWGAVNNAVNKAEE